MITIYLQCVAAIVKFLSLVTSCIVNLYLEKHLAGIFVISLFFFFSQHVTYYFRDIFARIFLLKKLISLVQIRDRFHRSEIFLCSLFLSKYYFFYLLAIQFI